MTLFCVAFALTFTSCGDDELPEPAAGTKANPYDVTQAINAVKGLTWTSNTVFEETDEVYVKGKISRIVDYGTFHESGTFSNASFYISKDGGTSNEFFCYRIRYFNRAAYKSGQADIKVGDRVVIYGRLMNYRGNTPKRYQTRHVSILLMAQRMAVLVPEAPSPSTRTHQSRAGQQRQTAATAQALAPRRRA